MPEMKTISCSIGYHCGGLGQHFSYIVENARKAGELHRYYTPKIKDGDPAGQVVTPRLAPWLLRWTPIRHSPGWRWHVETDLWDRKVAGLLRDRVDCVAAFGGQALHTFRAAQRLGAKRLEVIAANSHVDNANRLYQQAVSRHPIEKPWLNEAQRKKTLEEYAMADIIWIASQYSIETFLREGVSESKLRRIDYPVDPRYTPAADPSLKPDDGIFRIVYVGALTVPKGIPLLIEAFDRFRQVPAELILVGGTTTRPMWNYVQAAIARDPRIKMAPGDPLPHFRRADVCVHPSWEDNLAYAACEALAAGVYTILTRDTGAREYVVEGQNGSVIPTGDVDAIVDRLVQRANLVRTA